MHVSIMLSPNARYLYLSGAGRVESAEQECFGLHSLLCLGFLLGDPPPDISNAMNVWLEVFEQPRSTHFMATLLQ
jgi:hypothetical protein